MKVLFKERDLLLFSVNPLPVSVYNLNSSFPTRLPGYFQSLFFDSTAHCTPLYFSLFFTLLLLLHDSSRCQSINHVKDFFNKAERIAPRRIKIPYLPEKSRKRSNYIL
jgi:hypothetical protein